MYLFQTGNNALKFSNMVGENFEAYLVKMANNVLKLPTMLDKFLNVVFITYIFFI